MKKPELISLLTQASVSPLGLRLKTNDPVRLRQKLYAARREAPEYSNLSFVIPAVSPEDTLYIVRKPETSNGET